MVPGWSSASQMFVSVGVPTCSSMSKSGSPLVCGTIGILACMLICDILDSVGFCFVFCISPFLLFTFFVLWTMCASLIKL